MISGWVSVSDEYPEVDTPVLACVNGEPRVAALFWDLPGHEDPYMAYKYWDDPYDDGKGWEEGSVTHWMPIPPLPAMPDGVEGKTEAEAIREARGFSLLEL